MESIMADITGDFTGSLVFIYDTDGNLLAKTTVTGHNPGKSYIEVAESMGNVKSGTRLQLLIVHESIASELGGTFNGLRKGLCRISIYGERQRDVRTSVRHTLNASAVISDMVIDSGPEELSAPLPVTIENMSVSGILIRSQEMRIETGSLLQVELNVQGKTGILYCEVIREHMHEDGAYRYGCQLYFFDK